jgi:MFS family permease
MKDCAVYPKFRWLMLIDLCLITAASTMVMISPASLMGVIAKDLGLSLGAATANFMGVFNLVVAISCICGGIVCDRLGLIPIFLFCLAMLILPTLAMPYFSDTLRGAMVIRIFQAMGAGPILALVSPLASLWFPVLERGIVAGFQGMSVSLGIALGFVIAPAIFEASGNWRDALSWMSVAGLIALAVTIAVTLAKKPTLPFSREGQYEANNEGVSDVRLVLKQQATWIGVLLVFCYMWVLNVFNNLTPAYLAVDSPLGMDFGPVLAGKYMLGVAIASMVGAVAAGFILKKVFQGRTKPSIAIGFLVFAVFSVSIKLPFVTSNRLMLLACLMIAGFFMAWIVPNAMAFVATHYPPHVTGKVVGLWVGVGTFGGTVGVILGAMSLRQTNSYLVSILIVGCVGLIGFLLTPFLKSPAVFGLSKTK